MDTHKNKDDVHTLLVLHSETPVTYTTQRAVVVQLTGVLMLYTVDGNMDEMDKLNFSRNKEIIKEFANSHLNLPRIWCIYLISF